MGLMGLWMLLPAGIIVVAWLLAASGSGPDRRSGREETAGAILARRLAAGKIDLDEYETTRAALGLSETLGPRGDDPRSG